jgi:hypothetical protein
MSNIAGKAYAMSVCSPIPRYSVWFKKLIFWAMGTWLLRGKLKGLLTLSLIHYARWVIVTPSQFPRLSNDQPLEKLTYAYYFFFSNFNGSWLQYVDSFSSAIPDGLDWFWKWGVKYPKSVPMRPFHEHILFHQIWTEHYYSAYPMASSNDVKSAKRVKDELLEFIAHAEEETSEDFQKRYDQLMLELQHDLSWMEPSPVVSLSAAAVAKRRERET